MLISRYLNGDSYPYLLDNDAGTGGNPAPEGTPGITPGGSDEGTPAEQQSDVNWQQRYEDIQPEYTRSRQQLAEAQRFQEAITGQAGPEARAQAFEALGIELEEDEPDDDYSEYDDPDSRLDKVEGQLQQWQQAQQEAEFQAQEDQFLSTGIEVLEEQEGREFSDEELNVLVQVARANRTATGAPDIAHAHDQLNALINSRQQEWVQSKKAPRRPGAGIAAGEAVDLSDPEARVRHAADLIAAAEQDE